MSPDLFGRSRVWTITSRDWLLHRLLCRRVDAAGGLEAVEDQSHRRGSLPDGSRDALHRAAADISNGKDPRRAGLQEQRTRGLADEPRCHDVGAGEQESVAIFGELAG